VNFAALHFKHKNRSAACAAEQGVSFTSMKTKDHPTYAQDSSRYSLICLITFIIFFVPMLILIDNVPKLYIMIYFLTFIVLFIISIWYYGWVVPFNLKCPKCKRKTLTTVNKSTDILMAHCNNCKVKWQLGYRFPINNM
jgi:hypothetical protein